MTTSSVQREARGNTALQDVRELAQAYGWKGPIRRKRDTIRWVRSVPFLLMQLSVLSVFLVGVSWVAVAIAFAFWAVRMFAITGFYHRYFSNRAFKTSRAMQLVMALWGSMAVQKGALWWAAHHRDHHRNSDTAADLHSPVKHGFWWSHMLWIMSTLAKPTYFQRVKELARFPELRFFDRFHLIVPVLAAGGMFALGAGLENWAPGLGTNGWQMLVWGFFVSTFVLYHTTYSINSLTHRFGSRRFHTSDESRNHWFFALITLGEGWHNNHHHYPSAARMGFRWWEIDLTWYGLWLMSKLGLIWDLRPVPRELLVD
jgi:stearoyl-CoA desaturase (delta-9 desaturase)